MTTPYTNEFFQSVQDGARRSAKVVVPLVLQWVRPSSIIDVGCGQGAWLAEFRELGVTDALGVDGDYVDRQRLEIPAECFQARDLSQPLNLTRRFDLAMSLEVAEHLPSQAADGFIESLTRLAPIVLFSAAIPHQGGTHHINEQWPGYWAKRFAQHDYFPIDCFRRRIWHNANVEWWYAQNMFFYSHRDYLQQQPALLQEHQLCPAALALVHPLKYLQLIEWAGRLARQSAVTTPKQT